MVDITAFNRQISSFENTGKNYLDQDLSQKTSTWAGRTVKRIFGNRSDSDKAISKLLNTIKTTQGFGDQYVSLAQETLDKIHSKGKPLTGRVAAQVLKKIQDAKMSAPLTEMFSCIKQSSKSADGQNLRLLFSKIRNEALGGSPSPRELHEFDYTFHRIMDRQIAAMSNRALLHVFRGLCSQGVLNMRITTPNEKGSMGSMILGDLNEIESFVNLEITQRLEGKKPGMIEGDDISASTLKILTEARRTSMFKQMTIQPNEYLLKGLGGTRAVNEAVSQKIQEIDFGIDDFKSMLEKSDLTINFDPFKMFTESMDSKFQNYFDRNPDKGVHYRGRRLFTEQEQLKGIKDVDRQRGVKGGHHPISSALNVGRMLTGTTDMYGSGFLILKDNVKKERTTYTPNDSFHSFHQEITKDRVDTLPKAMKDAIGKFPKPLNRLELDDIVNAYKKEALKMIGQTFGLRSDKKIEDVLILKDFGKSTEFKNVKDKTAALTDNQIDDLEALLSTVVIKHFSSSQIKDNPVSTFDKLEQLLDGTSKTTLEALKDLDQHPTRINGQIGQYFEGQIHGGLDIRTDVRAIHLPFGGDLDLLPPLEDPDISIKQVLERARAFCTENGIELVLYAPEDKWLKNIQAQKLDPLPDPKKELDSDFTQFKKELPKILDIYKGHELSFDPTDIHGRGHISRVLVYARALCGIFKSHGMKVDGYGLYRAIAFHDSGRKANGKDVYEKDSANNLSNYLKEQGVESEKYISGLKALIDRDEKGSKTLEGLILQSSDSLDIIRVFGKDQFNTDYLSFMREPVHMGKSILLPDPELLKGLIEEVDRFIGLTSQGEPGPPEVMSVESQAKADELREAYQKELKAYREKLDSQGYFDRMETLLTDNKESFPILYENYMK